MLHTCEQAQFEVVSSLLNATRCALYFRREVPLRLRQGWELISGGSIVHNNFVS